MEETIYQLKEELNVRKEKWEAAKDLKHATSVFVSNRRIQRLNEALQFIAEIELIDEYTKR